jgi:hypothetical protein
MAEVGTSANSSKDKSGRVIVQTRDQKAVAVLSLKPLCLPLREHRWRTKVYREENQALLTRHFGCRYSSAKSGISVVRGVNPLGPTPPASAALAGAGKVGVCFGWRKIKSTGCNGRT